MAIRKRTQEPGHSKAHAGAHDGAAALASRAKMHTELANWKGKETLIAFLECSKCYERVAHNTAG